MFAAVHEEPSRKEEVVGLLHEVVALLSVQRQCPQDLLAVELGGRGGGGIGKECLPPCSSVWQRGAQRSYLAFWCDELAAGEGADKGKVFEGCEVIFWSD